MSESEKIDFIVGVMKRLTASQHVRLQNGARMRKEIRAAIQRGERPTGYRVEWLRDSGYEIIKTLTKIAKQFDKEHLQDKASVQDLMDVITTALFLLKKATKDYEQSLDDSNDDNPKDGDFN